MEDLGATLEKMLSLVLIHADHKGTQKRALDFDLSWQTDSVSFLGAIFFNLLKLTHYHHYCGVNCT